MKIIHTIIIRNILAIFVLALVLGSCATHKPVKDAAVWIDVRTPGEYSRGHLDSAVNIPYQQISQRINEVVSSKNEKIYVYCASGHRAEIARKTLAAMGYTDVTNAGGYRDLVAHTDHADAAQSKN